MDSSTITQPPGGGPVDWRARARTALMSILAAGVIGVVIACGGDQNTASARGRNLELHASTPTLTDGVTLTDTGGKFRVLRPTASNKRLAVVSVTIVNRTTLVVPLLVDTEAALLGDRRGQRFGAVDPFVGGVVIDSIDPDETVLTPMLWGQVELENSTQVTGWMLFEVPKGMTLGTIWWEEVDPIVADFIDYRRE